MSQLSLGSFRELGTAFTLVIIDGFVNMYCIKLLKLLENLILSAAQVIHNCTLERISNKMIQAIRRLLSSFLPEPTPSRLKEYQPNFPLP